MTLTEFRERLKTLHPAFKGIIFTACASFVFFIEQWLVGHSVSFKKDAIEGYKLFEMGTLSGVLELILWAPLREELTYRGPVWITAIIAGWFIKKRSEAFR